MRKVRPVPSFESVAQIVEEGSVPEPNSGCRLWLGEVSDNGYARVYDATTKKHMRVARLLLGLPPLRKNEKIALIACHRCDTRCCVNRDHLFIGTNADNRNDAKAKGRIRSDHSWADRNFCVNGHPLSTTNTYQIRAFRRCRVCHRESMARYRHRLRNETETTKQ